MTSIMTNRSAIAAVDSLRSTDRYLTNTENRVSSGLRVASASDNAAYWSITTTMRSDDSAMGAVEDALGLGAAKVDVAYMGMSQAVDVLREFKSKLVAAREPGVDRDKINSELVQLRAQMRSIADGASFNGENWLVTADGANEPDRELVASFIRADDGTVRVGTVTYGQTNGSLAEPNRLIDDTSAGMYGILTQPGAASGWDVAFPNYVFMTGEDPWPSARLMAVDATTTNLEIDTMIDGAEYMEQQLVDATARLGSMSAQLENQTGLVRDLRDTNHRSVGLLRDADMNEESARLKALQTRQQLGLQSLSIANTNSDNVRSLFG